MSIIILILAALLYYSKLFSIFVINVILSNLFQHYL